MGVLVVPLGPVVLSIDKVREGKKRREGERRGCTAATADMQIRPVFLVPRLSQPCRDRRLSILVGMLANIEAGVTEPWDRVAVLKNGCRIHPNVGKGFFGPGSLSLVQKPPKKPHSQGRVENDQGGGQIEARGWKRRVWGGPSRGPRLRKEKVKTTRLANHAARWA